MFFYLKDYQPLDPKLFKAFMAAAETENFTNAAIKACMTQSGVSQHIAKLEDQIGLPLFKRVGKRVTLTDTGRKLCKYIEGQVHSLDSFLDSVREQHENLTGLVSYAMPASCLLSPHFPMLLEKRRLYSDITLNVTLAPNPEVINMVLEDQIDFGFITQKTEHPQLKFQYLYSEEYILVGSDEAEVAMFRINSVLQHRYINYPGASVHYDSWLKHHCGKDTDLDPYALVVSGDINSIEGAIKMVVGGLGLGVFPRHGVQEYIDRGELFEYATSREPLQNAIHIVSIAKHEYPRRVGQVVEWFLEMMQGVSETCDSEALMDHVTAD